MHSSPDRPYLTGELQTKSTIRIDAFRYHDPMDDRRIVMTTAGSMDEAHRLAVALVESKLAACVNIVPKIISIYRWKEKTEETEEWLLWIKTSADFKTVRDAILQMHSYEVPECVAITIAEGSGEYLRWLDDSSR